MDCLRILIMRLLNILVLFLIQTEIHKNILVHCSYKFLIKLILIVHWKEIYIYIYMLMVHYIQGRITLVIKKLKYAMYICSKV